MGTTTVSEEVTSTGQGPASEGRRPETSGRRRRSSGQTSIDDLQPPTLGSHNPKDRTLRPGSTAYGLGTTPVRYGSLPSRTWDYLRQHPSGPGLR